MALTQEDILRRQGRPVPPPQPAIKDLLASIVESLNKLDGKPLSGARTPAVQTALGGVLSNINAELADIAHTAKCKDNLDKANKLAAAKAALEPKPDKPATAGQ
jgi:hypothetical protein